MRKVLIGIGALMSACLLNACDAGVETTKPGGASSSGWSSDPRDATDPDRTNTPLKDLPGNKAAEDAVDAAADAIDKYRARGVDELVSQLKQDLEASGRSPQSIANLKDSSIGKDLPSALDSKTGKPLVGLDTQGHPVLVPGVPLYGTYFECPIYAPEPTQEDDCTKLIQPTVLKVQQEIEQSMGKVESEINAANPTMSSEGRSFVTAWGQTALRYGVSVAVIYATQELRAAGACDTKIAGLKVSRLLGEEQGQRIVESHYGWAQQQVLTCRVNTDVVAEEVRTMSLGEVGEAITTTTVATGFMKDHPVCENQDVNTSNQVLVTAEATRREGIQTGIATQVEVLRSLLLEWSAACRRTGDPLVIDLDGNGVGFSAAPVTFDLLGDGHPQQVSWVGPRAALLAIDLDGDGRIGSGAELFGDRSDCGSARCLDGVMALGDYDRQARGGNGDGQIDSRDAVYPKLRLWTDANQDGVSQPSELSTLAAAGVLALSLQADRRGMGNVAGASTAELQVLTRDGFRTAYELWLTLGLTTENLAALKP